MAAAKDRAELSEPVVSPSTADRYVDFQSPHQSSDLLLHPHHKKAEVQSVYQHG